MHETPRHPPAPVPRPSRQRRRALAVERIAASRRERVPGIRGSSRLIVSGIVVALGATSFVVASAADIEIAPTLCSSSSSSIRGTAGNDVLVGTSSNDIIWGGGGDDVISGLQGNDRLCGVDGNDRLYGGSGDDYLDGGVGTDILRGDSGTRDTCLNGEQRAGCELVGTTTPPPTTTPPTTAPATTAPTTTTTPPTTTPPTGRFNTLPVGATLPSEQQCATAVRRMSENRPGNATYNATRGTTANTAYPRVTGNFTGTTDEILQWVACKWGIDEDLVRAQVAIESWWDQKAGGDLTSTQANCHPDVRTTSGQCPESIGLMQVRYVYHGTAFVNSNAIRSSAYNVDYAFADLAVMLRGPVHLAQHRRAWSGVPQRRRHGLRRRVVLRTLAHTDGGPVHRQGRRLPEDPGLDTGELRPVDTRWPDHDPATRQRPAPTTPPTTHHNDGTDHTADHPPQRRPPTTPATTHHHTDDTPPTTTHPPRPTHHRPRRLGRPSPRRSPATPACSNFRTGVFQRNVDVHDYSGASGWHLAR